MQCPRGMGVSLLLEYLFLILEAGLLLLLGLGHHLSLIPGSVHCPGFTSWNDFLLRNQSGACDRLNSSGIVA
jgi:hypothetical protein